MIWLSAVHTKVHAQKVTRMHAEGRYSELLVYGSKIDSLRGDEALLVADAFFRNKNPGKAEEILRKVIGRGYTTEEAYWQLTQVLLAQEKWLPALDNIEKALKFNTSNFTYLKVRAGILLQLGKNREAEAEYRKLLRLRPHDESLHWLTYQSIVEQEDYRRGKNFLLSNLSKFKTSEFKNKVYDALVRFYQYTVQNPDSALYWVKKWQAETGKNTLNVPMELIILNTLGRHDEAIKLYVDNKRLFSPGTDGVLFDEISGHSEFALQVYHHVEKSTYTMYIMDAERKYIQGKIIWKKIDDGRSEAIVSLPRQSIRKIYSIPISNYQKIKQQSINIAKSVNNLE
ncbi:MAG: tetratricopeptide repeat protein [Thermaurantimonas sp.]